MSQPIGENHWPYPRWIAHRGAGKLAPENTLAAFKLGARHGYRMFECDVKLSSDDVPFLLHDSTLERTTSGHGTAGEQPWSALAREVVGFSPAVDVKETDKEYRVSVELAGMSTDDIDVTLESGHLTIRGEKKSEKKDAKPPEKGAEKPKT